MNLFAVSLLLILIVNFCETKRKSGLQQASSELLKLVNRATRNRYYHRKYACSLWFNKRICRRRIPVWLRAEMIRRNGSSLVKGFAEKLEEKLKRKSYAVKRAVEKAEKAFAKYEFKESLRGITYFNAKRINRPDMVDRHFTADNPYRNFILKYDTHFKADINESHSVIHVPTNVFDGSVEINNGAAWTKQLNEIFVENAKKDSTIYWQYFGASTGFIRVFPGSKWALPKNTVDMFDCRTKNWYIQASCSPKDLVILLDTSGSMEGLRFRIAIYTVVQILKTLGEDDFFNVIKFDATVDYVDQCFNGTMIQATIENKERMRRKLRRIQPQKMANFEKALTEAFKLFGQATESGKSSMCNQAIMLITDGAPDTYEKVFETYNQNTSQPKVRVFSYLIGQDSSYNAEIHRMACRNKGYYVEIKNIAAVQVNMQQYVSTMARPLAISNYTDVTWTGVYIDDAEYDYGDKKRDDMLRKKRRKKRKLLKANRPDMRLMTSAAAPVFNRKIDLNYQELLGVMGTDLPIFFFRQFIPPSELGVNTYAFATNHNGYVLFHPNYKPPFDAPDYTQIDLVKLEKRFKPRQWYKKIREVYNSDNKLKKSTRMKYVVNLLNRVNFTLPDFNLGLRKRMAQGKAGMFKMTSFKVTESHGKPKVLAMRYYYAPIPSTPFTLAVAVPHKKYANFEFYPRFRFEKYDLTALKYKKGLHNKIPSQWSYCDFTAEESAVTLKDYHQFLDEMNQNFREVYKKKKNLKQASVSFEYLQPFVPAKTYCNSVKAHIERDATVVYRNDSITIYNLTSVKVDIYDDIYSGISRFDYVTNVTNETLKLYRFDKTTCIDLITKHHIDQLREEMQDWIAEKKFKRNLEFHIEKGDHLENKKCKRGMIKSLLFDAEMTKDAKEVLSAGLTFYHGKFNVSMIFIATRSGLTRYLTSDNAESDFVNTHPETIREAFYEKAVEYGPRKVTVSMCINLPHNPKKVILAQPIYVRFQTRRRERGTTAVGVTGLELPAAQLGKIIFSNSCSGPNCYYSKHCSSSNSTTACYLLDDSGYVMFADDESLVGQSFAEIDPDLFIELTNFPEMISNLSNSTSVYQMLIYDDYQEICPIYEEKPSASARRLINIFTQFSSIMWNFLALIISVFVEIASAANDCLKHVAGYENFEVLQKCVESLTESSRAEKTSSFYEHSDKIVGKQSCTKRSVLYRLNAYATRLQGQVNQPGLCRDCSTCKIVMPKTGLCFFCNPLEINSTVYPQNADMPICKRSWKVMYVPNTNMILLMVFNGKACICRPNQDVADLLQQKILHFKDDDEQCQLLSLSRERRIPEGCANTNPNEDVTMCGADQIYKSTAFLVMTTLIITGITLSENN